MSKAGNAFLERPKDGRAAPGEVARILALARPHSAKLAASLALLGAYAALGLVVPWAISNLLDKVLVSGIQGDRTPLDRFALGLTALFLMRAIFLGLHTYLIASVGGLLVLSLRSRLFSKLTHFGPDFFDDRRVGELVARVMSDIAQIQSVVTQNLATLVSSGLTFLGALVILVWRSWRLSALILLIIPPLVGISWLYGRRMRRLGETVQERNADVAAGVEESLGAIRLVQAFGREPFEQGRFEARARALLTVLF